MKYRHKDPNVKHVYNNVTNIKGKKSYPYKFINERINWFEENYQHVMEREEWCFHQIDSSMILANNWKDDSDFFMIKRKPNNSNHQFMSGVSFYNSYYALYTEIDNDSIRNARQYGWLIDNQGIVYDFNKKIFNENKFIIQTTDLGLL